MKRIYISLTIISLLIFSCASFHNKPLVPDFIIKSNENKNDYYKKYALSIKEVFIAPYFIQGIMTNEYKGVNLFELYKDTTDKIRFSYGMGYTMILSGPIILGIGTGITIYGVDSIVKNNNYVLLGVGVGLFISGITIGIVGQMYFRDAANEYNKWLANKLDIQTDVQLKSFKITYEIYKIKY